MKWKWKRDKKGRSKGWKRDRQSWNMKIKEQYKRTAQWDILKYNFQKRWKNNNELKLNRSVRIRKENEIRRNEKTTPERGMWKSLYKKESRERKANREIQGRKKLKREKKTKRGRQKGRTDKERTKMNMWYRVNNYKRETAIKKLIQNRHLSE